LCNNGSHNKFIWNHFLLICHETTKRNTIIDVPGGGIVIVQAEKKSVFLYAILPSMLENYSAKHNTSGIN
jgi:hypothetical protein